MLFAFKEWLFQEEVSFERSFEDFKKLIDPVAVTGDIDLRDSPMDHIADKKDIILQVLKEKNTPPKKEIAFLHFLIGFAFIKKNALLEDIQMAWDTYDYYLKHKSEFLYDGDGFDGDGFNDDDAFAWLNRQSNHIDSRSPPFELGIRFDELDTFRRQNTKGINKFKAQGKLLPGQKAETVLNQDIKNDLGQIIHYTIYKIPGLSKTDAQDKTKIDAQHVMMCHLGKGTKWCTASPQGTYYENYLNDDIYVVHRNGQPQYQLNVTPKQSFNSRTGNDVDQFMDVNDNPVSTGTYSRHLYRILVKLNINAIHPGEKYNRNDIIKRIAFEDYIPNTPEVDALITNSKDAYAYAKFIGGKVSPQIETLIAQTAIPGVGVNSTNSRGTENLMNYARIVGGRVSPELEAIIAKTSTNLFHYAQTLKGPLPPELEQIFYKKLETELPTFRGAVVAGASAPGIAIVVATEYSKLANKKLPPELLARLGIAA